MLLQQLLVGSLLLGGFQLPLLHHVASNGLRVCTAQTLVVGIEARLGGCLARSILVQARVLGAQIMLAQLWPTLLSSGAMSGSEADGYLAVLSKTFIDMN